MWVSWQWMSQWVDTTGVDPVAFAQRFTCTVAEIDSVRQWGQGLDGVVVCEVVAVVPHPNADKLRLGTVDLGNRHETVVCGAPDLRVGMRVPFVPPGTTLPSGIVIKDGEVRGVRSPGMLASEADLGLSDHHDGLLSLDGVTAPAGTPLYQALDLRDTLYEVDNKSITHRPDLWGQYGMAREVAAMLDRPLLPLHTAVLLGQGQPLDVQVQAPEACPRYVCARIAGAQVGPSPVQARLLLRRLGVRPISNVVDATNLVMLETGNPLHAFDARQVRGNQIVVRRANAGEVIATLDGQHRTLSPADLVIADAEGPVALAGIMGGQNSEIRDDTTEIVLEAAAFDAATVRKTALRLGLRTESSARFEKALDPALPEVAARRFIKMLVAFCPTATVTSDLHDAGPFSATVQPLRTIGTTTAYLRTRLGVSAQEMPDAWIVACLQRLEFAVQLDNGALSLQVPPFRATKDVRHRDDIVEELGRHYGYDRIASQAPKIASRPPYTPATRTAERQIRQALVLQQGLTEVVLYGFDHEGHRARLAMQEGQGHPRLSLRNTLSSEHKHLRRNLAPNLLACLEHNLQHGDGKEAPREGLSVAVFELGRAFVPVPQRALTPIETAALDSGAPLLAHDGHSDGQRKTWFGLMNAEMAAAVQATVAASSPLPFQPLRLGVAIGERLGGGAEGSKQVQPERAVSQRVFAAALAAIQAAVQALGRAPLQVATDDDAVVAELSPAGAPDWQTSWRHPQRSARLLGHDGAYLGLITLVHPHTRHVLAVPAELAVAELDLVGVLAQPELAVRGATPHKHAVTFLDVTARIGWTTRQAQVCATVHAQLQQAGLPVEGVRYLYEAPSDGLRAMTVRISCRAADRTLSAADLTAIQQQAQSALLAFGHEAA